jgi:hypothetical protein
VALWDEISAAAVTMRRQWDGAGWPSIRSALVGDLAVRRRTRVRWFSVAAAAAVIVMAAFIWRIAPSRRPAAVNVDALTTDTQPLLTKSALRDIERAEADYANAIERLAQAAGPAAGAGDSPLLAAQREKLQMLDASIAELRAAIEANRLNTQLRQQLLAMYQEKRETLQEIIGDQTSRADKPGL